MEESTPVGSVFGILFEYQDDGDVPKIGFTRLVAVQQSVEGGGRSNSGGTWRSQEEVRDLDSPEIFPGEPSDSQEASRRRAVAISARKVVRRARGEETVDNSEGGGIVISDFSDDINLGTSRFPLLLGAAAQR